MDNTRAETVAKILLDLKAVTFNPKQPYKYASGIVSPVYTDCRVIISSPEKRTQIINFYLEAIKESGLEFDVVAGTATAGIPHAAWIADKLNMPMAYVRGKAKDHGKENTVEGALQPGQKVIIIEDLVSTGDSSINSFHAIKAAGGEATHVFSIMKYGLKKGEDNFDQNNLTLVSLTDFQTILKVAKNNKDLTDEEIELVQDWLKDPEGWGKRQGHE